MTSIAITAVTPSPGTTPTPTTIPAAGTVVTIEERAKLMASEIESHMLSFSPAFLTKLQAIIAASGTLPFGLEPFRQDVIAFLPTAIAYVQDVVTALQLAAQLAAVAALPTA